MENKRNEELQAAAKRIAAIFAFIVVIAIGIFGSLALASAVPGAFSGMAAAVSSVFSGNEDGNGDETPTPTNQSIAVSAPSTVADGQAFTLSWGHTGKTQNGTYAFRYDCVEGVSFSANGTDITCNQAFTTSGMTGSLALTASSNQEPSRDITLNIDFTPEGASAASVTGNATISVTYTAPTTNTGTGTGGTTTTTQVPTSDPNGYTDLTVRFVAIGVVNRNTGTFYPVSYPSRSSYTDRIAVRFEVKNEGTKTSPQWFFRANLPTQQSYTFNSQAQAALRPGESIIFTLAFDGFVNSTQGTASVSVDPNNYVQESNESNNYAAQIINTVP